MAEINYKKTLDQIEKELLRVYDGKLHLDRNIWSDGTVDIFDATEPEREHSERCLMQRYPNPDVALLALKSMPSNRKKKTNKKVV